MKLGDLAARLGCELRGDGSVEVARVRGIVEAEPGDLTFVSGTKYLPHLAGTRASAVILGPGVEAPCPSLVSAHPYLTFAKAVALLHPEPRPAPGIHPSAEVDPTASLGQDVHVGARCVVGAGTVVGDRTVLHASVTLYPGVTVGTDCVLHSGVQVRDGSRLGQRVVVQNGAVIGSDGFGFAKDAAGRYHKIPQVGTVVVEDDVEIGALTAIDRAALGETRLGRGTKLDNLVQIGHSVQIGEDTVLAGQVGVAGSTRIGRKVTLAGQVGVAGHITIGDGAIATAQSGIPSDVPPGAIVSGSPAIDNRTWLRSVAVFARLPELHRKVKELARQVEALASRGSSA
jgi:UDP-3-O-[3-hydroxymyristoyl] glucosamine N-acyltransferase